MKIDDRQLEKYLIRISDFIQDTDLENAKEQLLDMFYAAITSEHLEDLDSDSRIVLTHFYIILLGLIEGIHWLGDSMIEVFRNSFPDGLTNLKIQCPYNCGCMEDQTAQL